MHFREITSFLSYAWCKDKKNPSKEDISLWREGSKFFCQMSHVHLCVSVSTKFVTFLGLHSFYGNGLMSPSGHFLRHPFIDLRFISNSYHVKFQCNKINWALQSLRLKGKFLMQFTKTIFYFRFVFYFCTLLVLNGVILNLSPFMYQQHLSTRQKAF